jgi:hypothetical protein
MQIPPLTKAACCGVAGQLEGMARILLARLTCQEYNSRSNQRAGSKHLIS